MSENANETTAAETKASPARDFVRINLAWLNTNRIFVYANLVLMFFLINGVASASGCRFDFTARRANSLSSSTAQVLAKMEDPILVEAYI
ncbi:MAG: hypothetical protein RIF32_22580, partial [Leptospirales bacterium]